ncbi:MAG: cell wall metabolism sensor histidine kinase WalK [Oscillospiraceae bacterium]|nr:cell wall metabolism sensor histidine kinase WalK [Oscillospiraceae bacterium]
MGKRLRSKLVFIMLLIVLLLMTVVLVFLVRGVQDFYTAQFYSQMEAVLTQEKLIHDLRLAAGSEDAVYQMTELIGLFSGRLGIDGSARNYYLLDGTTADILATSDPDAQARINITPNISLALVGVNAYSENARQDYMDVAVPIVAADTAGETPGGEEPAASYVLYIIDNKQTVQDLNAQIFSLIIESVLIGFAISIAVILIISRTLLSPIQGMTRAAAEMADGDFSRKINVESKDEIGILAETFNDMASQIETMLEELKRAEILRREFVANVSHELRTPLTSIRTYAETISENRDIPQQTEEEFLRVIINESDRMTKIVQDLLELSRFDSGQSTLTIEDFSIEKSLRDVYAAIALEAKKRGHEFNLELEWKIPVISGDRARIEQVLMNIITNALKYTPDGGRIDIYGATEGDMVYVRIEDTGIGIPTGDIERVFDRFYRVDKARTRESGGTGLGLSIAKEIVTRHGGDIKIKSSQDKGTAVTVMLPIVARVSEYED